jgi:hypothetical protein
VRYLWYEPDVGYQHQPGRQWELPKLSLSRGLRRRHHRVCGTSVKEKETSPLSAADVSCPVLFCSVLQDGSGDCSDLSCIACPVTSYADSSACAMCGNSTMGVGSSGDCSCDFTNGEVSTHTTHTHMCMHTQHLFNQHPSVDRCCESVTSPRGACWPTRRAGPFPPAASWSLARRRSPA